MALHFTSASTKWKVKTDRDGDVLELAVDCGAEVLVACWADWIKTGSLAARAAAGSQGLHCTGTG